MKKRPPNEIHRTMIKHHDVIFDSKDFEQGFKVLYLDRECVLLANADVPFRLNVTSSFDINVLTNKIGDDLYEVRVLALQPSFECVSPDNESYCRISDWLLKFDKVSTIRFKHVDLNELWLLRNLPFKHLIVLDVKYDNLDDLTNSILNFRDLALITHDHSLPENLIRKVKAANPQILFKRESEEIRNF